jgi:hypothetical protein
MDGAESTAKYVLGSTLVLEFCMMAIGTMMSKGSIDA